MRWPLYAQNGARACGVIRALELDIDNGWVIVELDRLAEFRGDPGARWGSHLPGKLSAYRTPCSRGAAGCIVPIVAAYASGLLLAAILHMRDRI
jgi:hypothetical protein